MLKEIDYNKNKNILLKIKNYLETIIIDFLRKC